MERKHEFEIHAAVPKEHAEVAAETFGGIALEHLLGAPPGERTFNADVMGIKFTMEYGKDRKGVYISFRFENPEGHSPIVLKGMPAEEQEDGSFRVYS